MILNVIAVMDDAAALKQCIMLGMGISILSKATVQADARQGKLLLFPLGEAAFSPETLSGVFAG